jgi:hypothetical protein
MNMLDDVTARLESFGYTVTENDSWMIDFIITKTQDYIKADCNVDAVPEGLKRIAVDMVCGEFLMNKKAIGQLTGFDVSAAIKSIQEGDTNVTYAIGNGDMTPEQRLDQLILYLINHGKGSLTTFRVVKW